MIASIVEPLIMRRFLAAVTASAFMCAPAFAGEFGPAATMAKGLSGVLAGVAIDAKGDALVAWQEPGSSTDRQTARYRPAGGVWSAPAVIGPPPADTGEIPVLQFKADGSAIAITTNGKTIWAEDMAPGGVWSKPHIIMASTAGPILVMNAAGDAAVVAGLTVVRRMAGATAWSAAEAIPKPPTGAYPQIDHAALGPSGDLLVPMISVDTECTRHGCEYTAALYAARETVPGAGWTMSKALWGPFSSTAFQYDSAAVIDGHHRAAIIFENGAAIQAHIYTPSGWTSGVAVFNDPKATGGALEGVTVDAKGDVTVALLDNSDSNFYAVVDGSIATNAWRAPVVVSAHDNAALAIGAFGSNDRGGVVLSWADTGGAVRVASRRIIGGTWQFQSAHTGSCTKDLPDCISAEAAAINDAGQMVATWQVLPAQTGPRSLQAATTK